MTAVSDELAVEVLGNNNAWYKAWIIDMHKHGALCTFENGWKQDQEVPYMQIRLLPKYPANYIYSLNEKIEAKTKEYDATSTNAPRPASSFWWPATITHVGAENKTFQIVYNTRGSSLSETVSRNRIRPYTTSSRYVHATTFLKLARPVPPKLAECSHIPGVLDDKAFRTFKENTGASLVRYDPTERKIIVLTPSEEVMTIVEKTFDYCLTMLIEKMVDILERKSRLENKIQINDPLHRAVETKTSPDPLPRTKTFSDVFTIDPNFMGLAIGTRGKNINEARNIEGITVLNLDEEECKFTIRGTSKEAVQKAREQLEYADLSIQVDSELTSRIIGKKGVQIQEMIDSTACVRVRLENPVDQDGEELPYTNFVFTGTKVSLKLIQIHMNCLVKHVRDMIKLANQNTTADSILREMIYSSGNSSGSSDEVYQRAAAGPTKGGPVPVVDVNSANLKHLVGVGSQQEGGRTSPSPRLGPSAGGGPGPRYYDPSTISSPRDDPNVPATVQYEPKYSGQYIVGGAASVPRRGPAARHVISPPLSAELNHAASGRALDPNYGYNQVSQRCLPHPYLTQSSNPIPVAIRPMPEIEKLTIETQTEEQYLRPPVQSYTRNSVKPRADENAERRKPLTQKKFSSYSYNQQQDPSYPGPRETYRVRDRRPRDPVRVSPSEPLTNSSKSTSTAKPRVNIRMVQSTLGNAIAENENMAKAEMARTEREQNAAIEDALQAEEGPEEGELPVEEEAETETDLKTADEDKENNKNLTATAQNNVNNQNLAQSPTAKTIENKTDLTNENVTKQVDGAPVLQSIMKEAIVCEFPTN